MNGDRPTYVSKRLVKELEELFPHKSLMPGDSVEEALQYGGKVQLIQMLKVWADEQSPDAHLDFGPFEDD